MARETAHGVRRLTNNLEDGNRASSTYRRRYKSRDGNQERGPPRARLIDRVTYEDGSQVNSGTHTINSQDNSNDTTGLFCTEGTQADQDNSLFCDEVTEPSQETQVDQGSSLFRDEVIKPSQETQADQGSSLFCTQVTEPSQASRPAPTPKPETAPKSTAGTPPIKLANKPKGIQGNRGNLYRGKDIIKLKVQNPKLRAIFANKPFPRTPKRRDGPVLRMGSKDKGI